MFNNFEIWGTVRQIFWHKLKYCQNCWSRICVKIKTDFLSIKGFNNFTNFPYTLLCLYNWPKLLIWYEFCQNRLSRFDVRAGYAYTLGLLRKCSKNQLFVFREPQNGYLRENSNRFLTITLPFLSSISIKVMLVYLNDLNILQNTIDRFASGFSQKNPRFPNWNTEHTKNASVMPTLIGAI